MTEYNESLRSETHEIQLLKLILQELQYIREDLRQSAQYPRQVVIVEQRGLLR